MRGFLHFLGDVFFVVVLTFERGNHSEALGHDGFEPLRGFVAHIHHVRLAYAVNGLVAVTAHVNAENAEQNSAEKHARNNADKHSRLLFIFEYGTFVRFFFHINSPYSVINQQYTLYH